MKKNKKLKVVELFAGVGGFRLGLEGWNGKSSSSLYNENMDSAWEVVWSNQWEPSTKTIQHANIIYKTRWPESNHSGENIEDVVENKFKTIPDHDLLVGGFPCQDYSVATTLKNSKGLVGKKGVLWWSIYNIILKKKNKPKYLLLENVDRLLVSPSNQRGRDFAVILSCLNELDYAVEWRVINAADYGMPQRRKRVFILAYHKKTQIYKRFKSQNPHGIVFKKGVFAKTFKVKEEKNLFNILREGVISSSKEEVSLNFNKGKTKSPFLNSGFMINGKFYSTKVKSNYTGKKINLGQVIEKDLDKIPKEYFITNKKLKTPKIKTQINGEVKKIETEVDMWKYLKGSKRELKLNKKLGYEYKYSEGNMIYPDHLDKPSRTIITGEGGQSPSRFKHVIQPKPDLDVFRRLIPNELELLNMFPVNHTEHEKVTDNKRAFFMGNALVVGIVEKIGLQLTKEIKLSL
tara:strand:- start:7301 stop:8683 length:1383 start_codon:yes stop_codon:yes gene_type:complete